MNQVSNRRKREFQLSRKLSGARRIAIGVLLITFATVGVTHAQLKTAPIFTVTNTNDSGDGSLRQAMASANFSPNIDTNTPDLIFFGIPYHGEHVRIQVVELLPRLEGQEIYIVDDDENRRIVTANGSFSSFLTREHPVAHYRIIVGSADYAADVSEGLTSVPQDFILEQNYPNPFNPTTQIRYQLSKPSRVVIEVFNSLGQRTQTLIDTSQDVGWYEVTWDARDYSGRTAASGVYYYRLRVGGVTLSRSMILMK